MRIGILGLGRIGAFHAATLAGLEAVDSLVVTDPVSAATASAVERFGATAVDSPRRCSPPASTASWSPPPPTRTPR